MGRVDAPRLGEGFGAAGLQRSLCEPTVRLDREGPVPVRQLPHSSEFVWCGRGRERVRTPGPRRIGLRGSGEWEAGRVWHPPWARVC